MKIKPYILLFALGIFLFGCNKKDPPAQSNASTTGSTPVTSPTGDYGTFLSVYNSNDIGGGMTFADSTIQATFYDSPNTNKTNISAGTVSVNATELTLWTSSVVYNKMNGINMKILTWQIAGSGTIAPASFSYTPSYPQYTGQNALPDTVTKSAGFTLNVNGIANTNKSSYISIGQSGASTITRTVAANSATFTISANDLSSFSVNNYFNIRISMFNYANVSLNSKTYGINANRTHEKYCYLK